MQFTVNNNNHKNKLAIITPGFYEQAIGGTEYQTYLFALAAKQFGYDVHYIYIALDINDKLPNKLKINLYPVKSPKIRKYLNFLGKTAITCLPQTWSLLKKIQPDIVYCRSGVFQAALGAYYSSKFNKKSIWQAASIVDVIPIKNIYLFKKPLTYIDKKFLEYGIKHSSIVLSQTIEQSTLLKKNYKKDSSIFRNFIPKRKDFIEKNNEFTVVWIGNIKPLKQPELFIQIAKSLSQYTEIKFIMIGNPAKNNYQKYIYNLLNEQTNIIYLKHQPINNVNKILSSAHLLISTSLYEGFSNTFLQAWLHQVPVISLNVNPDNILTKYKIGIQSKSLEKIKKDILMFYNNREKLNSYGQRGANYVRKYHLYEENNVLVHELLKK